MDAATLSHVSTPDAQAELVALLDGIRRHSGLLAKQDIRSVAGILDGSTCLPAYPNGDDAAAIPVAGGYQLLAIEGFLNEFVQHDPWFAGWCGVMVNLSDIAAMGGHPQAVVNAVWGRTNDSANVEQILAGMVAAANAYRVPIAGGHTNLHSNQAQLSVAVSGHARHLLSSFNARAGEDLVVAIDLRGAYRAPYLNWNAATAAAPERLRGDLKILPEIADARLAAAAKDISQAGLLGTLLMLAECSQVGAHVLLDRIPKPADVAWTDWLKSFPSFGFVLACPPPCSSRVLDLFHRRGIAAAVCGSITADRRIRVQRGEASATFWNLDAEILMGLS